MKTICSAIALTIALPALASAQTTPAAPAAPEHSGHDQPMDHKMMDHGDMQEGDCAKMNPGADKDCCEKHAKDKAKSGGDMGHEGMQH